MTNDLSQYLATRPASSERPLLGLTILVVEDSRFASEALRLMCQRLGARIRRADCIASAHRHLQTYRPNAVIVDMGLPDGDGSELIAHICTTLRPRPAILGLSGTLEAAGRARAAGADGFLAKPLEDLAFFRQSLLAALSPQITLAAPSGQKDDAPITPDPLALRDDLIHAADLLRPNSEHAHPYAYVSNFLASLARSAHDDGLQTAAADLSQSKPDMAAITRVSDVIRAKLASSNPF